MKNLQTRLTKLCKTILSKSAKTSYTSQTKPMLTIVFVSVFGLSGCFGYKALPSVKNPSTNPAPQKCPKVQQIVIGLLDDTPCEDCAQKDGIKELEKPTKNQKQSKKSTQESNTQTESSEPNPANNALGITQDEAEQALLAGLNDLCQELDEMYVVSLRYGSDLVESTSKGVFIATSIKQASVKLELEFIPDFFNGERRRFSARANANMELKSKKVLEIGKRIEIESKDKAYLLRKAMDSAIKEISKGIKRASASQNTSPSPAKPKPASKKKVK